MVHGVNAGVAHTTVGAPRRPIELTRGAPLHPHVYVVYEHVLVVAALVVAFVFDHVLYVNYSIPQFIKIDSTTTKNLKMIE